MNTVSSVNLFRRSNKQWRPVARVQQCEAVQIDLEAWQLPELLAVVVGTDGITPDNVTGAAGGASEGGAGGGVALPVVPEIC